MPDVEAFFASYKSAWWARANSAEIIAAHWATDEPHPFYKAEEIPHFMTDWDNLRAYWRHNEGFNEINELSFADLVTQPLGESHILVGLKMRWDIKFAADAKQIDGSAFAWAGQTMGGDNHVAATLKQVDNEWRLTSWVEAPDAPILYIADLYLKNVRPDFPAS